MAFYKNFENKTRQEKRAQAFARGGYDDEGSRYQHGGRWDGGYEKRGNGRGYQGGDRPDKPSYDRGHDGKPGNRKPYGDKPAYGQHRPYGDKPSFGPKSGYQGGGKPRYDERKGMGRPYGDKPRRDAHKGDFERRGPKPQPARRDYESFRYEAPVQPRYEAPKLPAMEEAVPAENLLAGRNPIREALKNGRDIEKLMVARGELSGSAREIVQMAKEQHIPVQEVDRARLDAITRNHQGMLAFASAYQYSTVEEMLARAEEKGEDPFLILLDGITDPHNLGAIIRSAECAGAHGVIVQERRAVGLTPAAVKASAGAVEYLPVARVTNLTAAIEKLQALNVWVYAADMDGEDYAGTDFSGGVALVIGAEGEGVSRRVLEACDKTVSLPIRGHVDSLNASVAAGILMYAVMRSR